MITFYNVTDFIESIYNELISAGNKVNHFPLYLHAKDKKVSNYFELLNQQIKRNEVIIFICIDIDIEELIVLRKCNQHKQFILLGYDEPYSFNIQDIQYEEKCKCFDIVFSPMKQMKYTNHVPLPPGGVTNSPPNTSSIITSYIYYNERINNRRCNTDIQFNELCIMTWKQWAEKIMKYFKHSQVCNVTSSHLLEMKKFNDVDKILDYLSYVSEDKRVNISDFITLDSF